jgi:hypothetical protein
MKQAGIDITYEDALNEVSSIKWEDLDTDTVYTIGFNHPMFHPFASLKTESGSWLISATTRDGQTTMPNNTGLPHHEEVSFTLGDIKKHCAAALTGFYDNGAMDFGYIASRNNERFIFPSTLLEEIRRTLYHNSVYNTLRKNPTYNRAEFVAFRAYFIDSLRISFTRLFPQYTGQFNNTGEFVQKVIMETVAYSTTEKCDPAYLELAQKIHTSISKKIKFTDPDVGSPTKIITDYVLSDSNILMLYTMYVNTH